MQDCARDVNVTRSVLDLITDRWPLLEMLYVLRRNFGPPDPPHMDLYGNLSKYSDSLQVLQEDTWQATDAVFPWTFVRPRVAVGCL